MNRTVLPDPRGRSEKVAALRASPVFAGLGVSCLNRLADAGRMLHLKKGDTLFLQDDPAGSSYLVCSGWIVIVLTSAGGRELVISEMRPGDFFGENAVLAGMTRTAGATAREDSELLEIARLAFLDVLDSEPQLARRLLDVAVDRLVAANRREGALAFLSAEARIAGVLLRLDALDRQTGDKGYVTVSQEELAQRTGLTRQTVAQALGRWRRRKWLETGRGRVVLLDTAALRRVEEESLL